MDDLSPEELSDFEVDLDLDSPPLFLGLLPDGRVAVVSAFCAETFHFFVGFSFLVLMSFSSLAAFLFWDCAALWATMCSL